MTQFAFSSLIDVKVGGAALPPTKMADGVADKLVAAWVDLGAGVPGAFQLTFRDKARREVLDLANIKIGTKIVLAPVADGKEHRTRCSPVRSPALKRTTTGPAPSPSYAATTSGTACCASAGWSATPR